MEIDRKKFKRMFPHLATELESKDDKVSISSIGSNDEVDERADSKAFDGYSPDVIDFIRRCDTEKQAEEIIEYLEKKT